MSKTMTGLPRYIFALFFIILYPLSATGDSAIQDPFENDPFEATKDLFRNSDSSASDKKAPHVITKEPETRTPTHGIDDTDADKETEPSRQQANDTTTDDDNRRVAEEKNTIGSYDINDFANMTIDTDTDTLQKYWLEWLSLYQEINKLLQVIAEDQEAIEKKYAVKQAALDRKIAKTNDIDRKIELIDAYMDLVDDKKKEQEQAATESDTGKQVEARRKAAEGVLSRIASSGNDTGDMSATFSISCEDGEYFPPADDDITHILHIKDCSEILYVIADKYSTVESENEARNIAFRSALLVPFEIPDEFPASSGRPYRRDYLQDRTMVIDKPRLLAIGADSAALGDMTDPDAISKRLVFTTPGILPDIGLNVFFTPKSYDCEVSIDEYMGLPLPVFTNELDEPALIDELLASLGPGNGPANDRASTVDNARSLIVRHLGTRLDMDLFMQKDLIAIGERLDTLLWRSDRDIGTRQKSESARLLLQLGPRIFYGTGLEFRPGETPPPDTEADLLRSRGVFGETGKTQWWSTMVDYDREDANLADAAQLEILDRITAKWMEEITEKRPDDSEYNAEDYAIASNRVLMRMLAVNPEYRILSDSQIDRLQCAIRTTFPEYKHHGLSVSYITKDEIADTLESDARDQAAWVERIEKGTLQASEKTILNNVDANWEVTIKGLGSDPQKKKAYIDDIVSRLLDRSDDYSSTHLARHSFRTLVDELDRCLYRTQDQSFLARLDQIDRGIANVKDFVAEVNGDAKGGIPPLYFMEKDINEAISLEGSVLSCYY